MALKLSISINIGLLPLGEILPAVELLLNQNGYCPVS